MIRSLSLCLAATLALTGAAPAQPDPGAGLLTGAWRAAEAGNWDSAAVLARRAGPVAADVLEWHRLQTSQAGFEAYRAFLERRPDWPGQARLRARAEASLSQNAAVDCLVCYFEGHKPQTGAGALALARALAARGEMTAAEAEAQRAWRTLGLSQEEQVAFLALFPGVLAKHHVARVDEMLWRERLEDAARLLPLLTPDWQALAQARIGLRRDAEEVNDLIAAVPAALAGDPGLAYERFAWRMRRDRYDDAAAFLDERSTSAEALGRPEVWAPRRALLVRREMREGNVQRAYRLASRHYLSAGSDYADLEWLAGYIALRKLDDPTTALRHFQNMRGAVSAPISLGRAGYWEGRAHEALGNGESAQAAYAYGAEYQTSFYGLLAAEKAGIAMDPALAGGARPSGWQTAGFTASPVFEAAMLLQRAGKPDLAERFFTHLAEGLSVPELEQLADLALSLDEPHIALVIAKQAAARGAILPHAYFPVTELGRMDLPVARELALAIARRESEFDPAVISHAGAQGLMQVMPGTARMMAAKLGEPAQVEKLTSDWRYNVRMGSTYLAHLQEEFGNSTVLVAAGYNAGPRRPRDWITALGDPRAPGVDAVDWIEHVPFTETRNYIMRVMEAIPIYRARLAGAPVPLRLSEELKAR